MRGKNHIRMGACTVAATAVVALPNSPELLERPAVVLVGVGLFMFGKVAPDLDHPTSAVTRSWSWATRLLSLLVIRPVARWIYRYTRTRFDSPQAQVHRGFTHTWPGALVIGLSVVAALVAGPPGAAIALGMAFGSAARVYDRGLQGYAALAGAIGGWFLWVDLVVGAPWLVFALALGCYAHAVDDCVTTAGAPLKFPWRNPRNGKRWERVGTPEWMRFDTGSGMETAAVWSVIVATSGLVYWVAVAPWITPFLLEAFTDGVG